MLSWDLTSFYKLMDTNFHYTECGMTKLLQEFSIAKLYMNIKLIKWVVNTPEIGKRTHTKKSTVLTKIVLRGHPSHYQQCYHDKFTCNVNKVCMILLISIYVFLISMGLFPLLSPKEIIFLSQWIGYHKYQIYCSVFIAICVTCVYDIVYRILKPYLRFVLWQ